MGGCDWYMTLHYLADKVPKQLTRSAFGREDTTPKRSQSTHCSSDTQAASSARQKQGDEESYLNYLVRVMFNLNR